MATLLKFTLPVVPRTKKNSSRVISRYSKKTGKSFTKVLPSKLYEDFERECNMRIPQSLRMGFRTPVNIKAIFFTESRRKIDLTNLLEALDDMLVTCGVIEDDCRDIVAGHDGSRVYHDKDNPRIEVTIEEISNYSVWKQETKRKRTV